MEGDAFTITGALILGALILKGTDFVKYATNSIRGEGDTRAQAINGLVTLALTALVGVGVVLVFRETQWADKVIIGDLPLSDLGWKSLIVFGLVVSSFGAFLYDLKKAIDRSDSARTPRLSRKWDRSALRRSTTPTD